MYCANCPFGEKLRDDLGLSYDGHIYCDLHSAEILVNLVLAGYTKEIEIVKRWLTYILPNEGETVRHNGERQSITIRLNPEEMAMFDALSLFAHTKLGKPQSNHTLFMALLKLGTTLNQSLSFE